MADDVLSCSLERDALETRLQDWAAVARHAISRRVDTDRIRSTYPPDPEIARRLRDLIAAEAHCCTFMRFTVEESPDEIVVELRVPAGMAEPLATMLG